MIQEIYDYLLIRSHFLLNLDEAIEKCKDKENFEITIRAISNVMQKEDYFLTSETFLKNISDLVQKYRFDHNKNKEINDEMNYIIGRLNEYNAMGEKHKGRLLREWLYEEYKVRKLPFKFQTSYTVFNAIANEHSLFMKMCGFKLNEEKGHYEYVGQCDDDVDIYNYLQLVNLLCNKFPGLFYDLNISENTVANIDEIYSECKDRTVRRYAKKTFNNLKKVLLDVKELKQELESEKRLVI